MFVLKIPMGSVGDSLARVLACPETRLAEPNYLAEAADTLPSDPAWGLQYGLVNIRRARRVGSLYRLGSRHGSRS